MRTRLLPFISIFCATFGLAQPALAATRASCIVRHLAAQAAPEYQLSGTLIHRDNPEIVAEVEALGKHAPPVAHTPPRNQQRAEDCWAQALVASAESARMSATGEPVKLSADHLQFWDVYYQIKQRLGYFREVARKLEDPSVASDVKKQIRLAYNVRAARKFSPPKTTDYDTRYYIPGTAEFESAGFRLTRDVGLVPTTVFDSPMTSDTIDTHFEDAIRNFSGAYLLKEKNIDRYLGNEADGINSNLYDDLTAYLDKYLTKKPLRPNDSFTYRGQTYTPRTFMSDAVRFDPSDFTPIEVDARTHELALEAIADSIDQGTPVSIGFDIFDDTVTSDGLTNDLLAEQTGVFTNRFCPGGKCTSNSGGHQVLVISYFYTGKGANRKITGFIVKNSWSRDGARDADGRIPENPSRGGYYIITSDYLKQSLSSDSWDFLLPNSVASKPQYHRFKIENQTRGQVLKMTRQGASPAENIRMGP